MSEPLTLSGSSDHGPPDPPAYATPPPRSVIDEQIDRDQSLLETLTLRCTECQRHGPAKDGRWELVSGAVYCKPCVHAEGIG